MLGDGPVALFEGGAVGVGVGLGPALRFGHERGDRGEIALGILQRAGRHLQFADGVEQRRLLLALMLRQLAVALDQLADGPAFALVADRQRIARLQVRVHQIEAHLQLQDGFVQGAVLLALPGQFLPHVEDGRMRRLHSAGHLVQE